MVDKTMRFCYDWRFIPPRITQHDRHWKMLLMFDTRKNVLERAQQLDLQVQ